MRLTALQWETCFCDLLSARGFSSAFTDEKASLFASLFRALDKKDPEDLFSADVLPVPAAVLTKSLCKPEGSLSPTAVFAALDVLAQAFCSFSGPSACLHFALPDPEPVVQLPDASSVKKRWTRTEARPRTLHGKKSAVRFSTRRRC